MGQGRVHNLQCIALSTKLRNKIHISFSYSIQKKNVLLKERRKFSSFYSSSKLRHLSNSISKFGAASREQVGRGKNKREMSSPHLTASTQQNLRGREALSLWS
jgi:hypothetical protein